jgi:hypothetical protein
MKLESLSVRMIPHYLPNAGNYEGEIVFVGSRGKVQVNLSHLDCGAMFKIVGQGVIDSAKEVAQNLTADVFDVQQKALGESHE